MSPKQFDLIVFDWDGTLFDSTALITYCIQASAVDLGLPKPSAEAASYVIGLGLRDALAHAVPELPVDRYAEMGLRFRHHYRAAEDQLTLFEGTLEMLAGLKTRQHRLAVATGKSRGGLDEALQAVELQGIFDCTRTADETSSKPHPQMLLELMDELGVSPQRTLMIGDTTHDLQLALNAGTASIGVGYGAHEHSNFAAFKPLHIAQSVSDLHAWLVQHA
jgi:phosphoglycolate phosphatase